MQTTNTVASLTPTIDHVDELGSTMKKLLSPADRELVAGDVRSLVSYVDSWADSYQRGLSTDAQISIEDLEMLKKTREQLSLILSERLTLEDEGGQPATKAQEARMDDVSQAICRIDQVLPVEGHSAAVCEPVRKRA